MAAPRLYRIPLAVGARVTARGEVRTVNEEGIITTHGDALAGTIVKVDGRDALVAFDALPDMTIWFGDYELRRAA